MNIRQKLQQAMLQVDALSLRERGMVMLAAFMVMFLVWDWILMSDIGSRSKRVSAEINTVQARMQQLNQAIATSAQVRGTDPNVVLQNELLATRTRITKLDEVLSAGSGSVIPPSEMARVIEQVLRRQGRLKLVSAHSLPPRPMFDTPVTGTDPEDPNGIGTVYRHGLELEVEGRYLDVLEYLRELESLDWQFFWETVALESNKYPSNRVRIRVYSLNLEEGWLGV